MEATGGGSGAPAPDLGTGGEFGPGDEETVVGAFTRAGEAMVADVEPGVLAAPRFELTPLAAQAAGTGPRGLESAAPARPEVGSGPRPAAPATPRPNVPAVPPPRPAPRLPAGPDGTAQADTAAQARAAISNVDAPTLAVPAQAPPVAPLTGSADPARMAPDAATATSTVNAEGTRSADFLDAQPIGDLRPFTAPVSLAGEGGPGGTPNTGPATEPASAPGTPANAVTAPAAGPSGGTDPAMAAARREWGAQIAPLLAAEQSESTRLANEHTTQETTARNAARAGVEALSAEGLAEQTRLREDTHAQVGQQRQAARAQFESAAAEGSGQAATLVAETDSQVATTRRDGEAQAATELTRGQEEAAGIEADAAARARAEQQRAQEESSGWFDQAVSFVQSAVDRVRSTIASVWQQARAAVVQVLDRARALARQVIDAVVSAVTGLLRRFAAALASLVGRLIAGIRAVLNRVLSAIRDLLARVWTALRNAFQRLVKAIQSALTRLWTALKGLLARLRAGLAALLARIRALIRRILRPIRVVVGPFEVFPRLPVDGRGLGRLSTGDIPVYMGEIPTEIGVFIVFVTMRTDADLMFHGGGLGPGMVDRLEVLVDPLGSRYQASGALSLAADASGGVGLTGTYAGGASWMGLAGLAIEGGPHIPLTLNVRGAARTSADFEYDHGAVTVRRAQDFELCLAPEASVNAFLRIKAFTGLPIGPGAGKGEGDCGPACPTCSAGRDDGALPYEEMVLLEHFWNLENYRAEQCWRWTVAIAAAAGGSGPAAASFSGRLDTGGAPALFGELHRNAAAVSRATPTGTSAAVALGALGTGTSAGSFRMRSQIQEKTPAGADIHHGSAAVTAGDPAKGVTAVEFERTQARAKANALAGGMPRSHVPGVDKAKAEQSKLIRTRTIPAGGIPATRVGDINELRVCFDPTTSNLETCRPRGQVRLDVENLEGHNLRCPS